MRRRLIFLPPLLLLTACATGPGFKQDGISTDLRPDQVAVSEDAGAGASVLWGGVIASSKNLSDTTQLEIIAYPLTASNQSPQSDKASQGRFLIISEGYLEPVDYANGRKVTVTGKLEGSQMGQIGETSYQYPVVSPGEIYLWPENSGRGGIPVRFGIGFTFHN